MLGDGLEPWQLLIVAVVIILLLGSKGLPDKARALGRSIRTRKSEAEATKDEGGAQRIIASVEETPPDSTAPAERVLRAVPDDTTTGRSAAEGRRTH
jgi:sec-independent protein translocase protein TatA